MHIPQDTLFATARTLRRAFEALIADTDEAGAHVTKTPSSNL